jgi:D-glycero-D-manno-heptose 1,7-bisphosphate phosphatase
LIKKNQKYIIFDRDGTLIYHIPYLYDYRKVKLLPTVRDSLRILLSYNYRLILHTNQSGISRGYFDLKHVEECNLKMIELIDLGEDIFTEICIAPDFPPNEITYRKPSPLFGIHILKKYNINKNQLIYVGDSVSDLLTAKKIGCNAFGVNTGLIDLKKEIKQNSEINFQIFDNLMNVVNTIINCEN